MFANLNWKLPLRLTVNPARYLLDSSSKGGALANLELVARKVCPSNSETFFEENSFVEQLTPIFMAANAFVNNKLLQ